MSNPTAATGPAYPRATQVQRAVRMLQKNGLAVSDVDIRSDGSFRLTTNAAKGDATTEFDRWDSEGRL